MVETRKMTGIHGDDLASFAEDLREDDLSSIAARVMWLVCVMWPGPIAAASLLVRCERCDLIRCRRSETKGHRVISTPTDLTENEEGDSGEAGDLQRRTQNVPLSQS